MDGNEAQTLLVGLPRVKASRAAVYLPFFRFYVSVYAL